MAQNIVTSMKTMRLVAGQNKKDPKAAKGPQMMTMEEFMADPEGKAFRKKQV